MPFVPASNTIFCSIRGTLFNEQIENGLYFRTAGVPTAANLATLAEGLFNQWETLVLPNLSLNYSLREVYAVSLHAFDAPTATYNPAETPPGGGDVSPSLPGGSAFVVSFRTAFRGRARRGRIYIPALPESQVTGNAVAAGWASAVVADVSSACTSLAGEGFEHVVVSRFANGEPRASALVTPVTSYIATDTNVDSQRRRLAGRGR